MMDKFLPKEYALIVTENKLREVIVILEAVKDSNLIIEGCAKELDEIRMRIFELAYGKPDNWR